jgi:NADH-quinone oxidoreductase subunit J
MTSLLVAATLPDSVTFAVAAVICVVGSLGVVLARNPVHSALMLVMTLFAVAVLFVEENAQFLAAVQVIVYAGAVVVLFLFVIMLLGVDRKEVIGAEPLPGQRPVAICLGIIGLAEVLLLARNKWPTGAPSVSGALGSPANNTAQIGHSVFTTYLLAFEVTAALLVVAVVAAVVLARRPRRMLGEAAAPPSPTKEHEADDGPGPGDPGPDEAETDDDPEATAWVPGGQDARSGDGLGGDGLGEAEVSAP